jgi:glycosyltransferase involved in cell wall biosynthesis
MTTEDLASKEKPDLSIVIPTWNGLELLRRNLRSVLEAQLRFLVDCRLSSELIIVDDASSDETVDRVPLEFPSARLVCRAKNGGFSKACNSGLGICRAPVIALLNNDVQVDPGYFLYQYPHFRDPHIFAVTAKVFEGEPPVFSAGGRFSSFRRGFWSVYSNYDIRGAESDEWTSQHDLLSLYAISGFAKYDRQKLGKLGGFTEVRLRAREKRLCRRTDVQVHDLLQAFYNTDPIQVFRSGQEIVQFHNKNGESDTQ